MTLSRDQYCQRASQSVLSAQYFCGFFIDIDCRLMIRWCLYGRRENVRLPHRITQLACEGVYIYLISEQSIKYRQTDNISSRTYDGISYGAIAEKLYSKCTTNRSNGA